MTQALDDTASTPLGRAAEPLVQAHPGLSGVLALPEGREAFATRMLLAEAAQRSLDVHAGYAKRRPALLRGGVKLFELKRDGAPVRSWRHELGLGARSSASLHAKTFAVDRQHVFVGSFNLDPRSAALNTESGLVIDSPQLAGKVSDAFERDIPGRSYALRLDEANGLEWRDPRAPDGSPQVQHHDPQSPAWQRALVQMLSWLPIEWLL